MKAVVTDYTFGNLDIEKKILEEHSISLSGFQCRSEGEVAQAAADADYVITQFAPVRAEAIAAMKNAKIIVRYGIGVDNVDLAAAAAKGIPVCNVPDFCVDEVADHTMAMMLALTRGLIPCWDTIRLDRAWKFPLTLGAMRTLRDMTVGLVAFGKISRAVAARLAGFKCKIVAFDPAIDPHDFAAAGVESVSLEQLYKVSDIISLHCPSNDKTRLMINAESLPRMKRGAILLNLGRGDLINTDDLIAALKSGQIGGAGLDVTNPEPIPMDSPLLAMNNVIINPHIASASESAVRTLRNTAAQLVAERHSGRPLRNVMNGISS